MQNEIFYISLPKTNIFSQDFLSKDTLHMTFCVSVLKKHIVPPWVTVSTDRICVLGFERAKSCRHAFAQPTEIKSCKADLHFSK